MDDLDRPVYCLFGLPFDAVTFSGALESVNDAMDAGTRCFLSTPNINFLIACQSDAEFLESVIQSDLSIADGMPVVWLARLLNIPIPERVAGSSLFDALLKQKSGNPLRKVYFFGGPAGVAESACRRLSRNSLGLGCAGWQSPGFGSVEALSEEHAIARINESEADFLLVALGAKKGQAWIMRNRARLQVPVISHLGAVVNFVAGDVKRAPRWMQNLGLEWLWRIKEEPGLWRRYLGDGLGLLRLGVGGVIPLFFLRLFRANKGSRSVELVESRPSILLRLEGNWYTDQLQSCREAFRQALAAEGGVRLDMAAVIAVGPGFLGLVLMLRKQLASRGRTLILAPVGKGVRRQLAWNRVEFLVD